MTDAISPLDGRYRKKVDALRDYFSEKGLMYYRCKLELLYILALDETGCLLYTSPSPRD